MNDEETTALFFFAKQGPWNCVLSNTFYFRLFDSFGCPRKSCSYTTNVHICEGAFINHVDMARGRGSYYITLLSKIVHNGGRGSKMSKNLSTWFINDP